MVQHVHGTECQPFAGNLLGEVWKTEKSWKMVEISEKPVCRENLIRSG